LLRLIFSILVIDKLAVECKESLGFRFFAASGATSTARALGWGEERGIEKNKVHDTIFSKRADKSK
jgi:hypothetical protein